MKTYSFLQDKVFLQQLDALHIKQHYIKITVLNWNEEPLQQIQGYAISGSVNLDSSSAMRRTATLSLFAEEKENNLANIDHLFSINKKCILEIGIVNTVPKQKYGIKDESDFVTFTTIDYQHLYGDIIWFPLGVFIMFNPSVAHSMTGVTISMQLKDKMCLLNGDLAGQIHSSVDFSYQDQIVDINNTSIEKNPVLIYNIIKQLVNHWGNESLTKIIISQVPLKIKQVVKWTGEDPIYFVKIKDECRLCLTYDQAQSIINEQPGEIITYNYGQDIGFIWTDFVYPGELVCNAGETVASVLDKIIGILGNYEYFYDVFGNFVFQEKENYLNMTNTAYWVKENLDKVELPSDEYAVQVKLSKSIYNFTHNEYTTAYNNTLNYNNIKNDFVVWGYRKGINGDNNLPCRYHLAIDKKPSLKQHNIILFTDEFQVTRAVAAGKSTDANVITRTSVDWREEIYYQMLEDQLIGTGTSTELNNTYFQYYAELKEQFPKIFDLNTRQFKDIVKQHPDQVNYFLDFIDDEAQISQYSVNNIGRRAIIIENNNEGINCVFQPMIPDVIYLPQGRDGITQDEKNLTDYGQTWTQINAGLYDALSIGGALNSCYEKIKDLLYQYTHMNNTISITTLPIYYLEPNTRITVEDNPAGISGDYIIQSISLPLDITSTMTINAYKALEKI